MKKFIFCICTCSLVLTSCTRTFFAPPENTKPAKKLGFFAASYPENIIIVVSIVAVTAAVIIKRKFFYKSKFSLELYYRDGEPSHVTFKKYYIILDTLNRNKNLSEEELEAMLEKEFPEQPPGPGSDDFILEPPLGDITNSTARDIVKNERIKPSVYTPGAGRLSAVYPKLKDESQDIEQALHEGFDKVNRTRNVPIPNRFFPSLTDLAHLDPPATEQIPATEQMPKIFYIIKILTCSMTMLIDDIVCYKIFNENFTDETREAINYEGKIKLAHIKQLELTGRFFKSEPRRPGAEKLD